MIYGCVCLWKPLFFFFTYPSPTCNPLNRIYTDMLPQIKFSPTGTFFTKLPDGSVRRKKTYKNHLEWEETSFTHHNSGDATVILCRWDLSCRLVLSLSVHHLLLIQDWIEGAKGHRRKPRHLCPLQHPSNILQVKQRGSQCIPTGNPDIFHLVMTIT